MMKHILRIILLCNVSTLFSMEISMENQGKKHEIRFSSETIAFTVSDGIIKGIPDFGIPGKAVKFPTGLGILRNTGELRSGHMPWGEPTLKQELPNTFPFTNYFIPSEQSVFSIRKAPEKITLSWKGLSNGSEFLPDAVLEMEFSEGTDGRILVAASGSNPSGGVFSVTVPVIGTGAESAVIPSFGGMRYELKDKADILVFGRPPFLEAPLAILEKDQKRTLGIWMEDPTSRPHHLFLSRSGEDFCAALEINALMPFENRTRISAPPVSIRHFHGDWLCAARPYRNWYAQKYAKEIAIRDAVHWTRNIQVISGTEVLRPVPRDLELIAKIFGKDTVMLMTWNARKPAWDAELPDWTPREGYAEGVRLVRQYGIRTMAYVNICCANYLSPVWKRDGLDDIFLTRKNSIQQYKENMKDSPGSKRNTSGSDNYLDTPDLRKEIRPNSLLYGDLLSPRWREYHLQMMKRWREETKTDANYEDTAGTTNDHGNGIINGLSAGEGDTAQMRLLLAENPNVPMAAEFAPASIAFGITWAFNYPSVYGNKAFQEYRSVHQLPLSAFLFGYRQWITDSRAYSDALKYTQSAVADASGGLGFLPYGYFSGKSLTDLESDRTFSGHLYQRAKLFAAKQLHPCFPENGYPENITGMYQGTDGIYSYYCDKSLQEMRDPSGMAVYGRIHNAFQAETSLLPENWPFYTGNRILGLNPEKYYPLFPRGTETALYAENIPDRVYLKRYFETDGAVYLELDSADKDLKQIEVDIRGRAPFTECTLNGKSVTLGKLSAELPFRLVCFTGGGKPAALSLAPNGCFNGKAVSLDALPRRRVGKEILTPLTMRNEIITLPLKAPSDATALEVTVRDMANIFAYPHDGTVFRLAVNGVTIKKYDTSVNAETRWTADREARKKMFDLRPRKWTLPLALCKGRNVLLTIEADNKENTQGDYPAIGPLQFIPSRETELKEEILQ